MTQGIQKVHDALCILAIRIMRGYSLYSPFEKGLCRINDTVISAARTLSNESRMVVRSRDGRKFVVNPKEKQYHMGLLGMGVFEPVETQAVVKCLSEGDVAFDVGANIGWYTTLLSQLVGPYGRVHAFEPVVDTFQALERNCKVNACTNVKLNNH